VKGTIQSIDQQTKQITLADGKTYTADASVDLASFKAGDSVTITTEEKNGQMTVTQLTKN
jgi:Cu/Ag efflux protein CusF